MMQRRNLRPWTVTAAGLAVAYVLAFQVPEFGAFQEDAATSPLVIYFSDGAFVSEKRIENGASYLPAIELAERLGIPYTDDPANGALSIRGQGGTIEVRHNSNTIAIDGGEVQLNWPSFRQDDRWWVPMEFLTAGASEITGLRFRYDDDAPRVFAGDLTTTLLDMRANQIDAGTRLTIRAGASIDVELQQNQNQVVLNIVGTPIAPTRESLEYEDSRVGAVRFDDRDGNARIVVEKGNPQVTASLTSIDQNRTYFVDFSSPPSAVDSALRPASTTRDAGTPVRVIVIDPGHGGLDNGASAHGTLEKDLTMALARQLRAALESRFDATIILTREGDVELTHEDRASIANNSQADLMISLHVGYSLDPTESSASLFVMDPPAQDPPSPSSPSSANAFFQPWYRAYATNQGRSREFATSLHESLDRAIPSWEFPVRHAPIGILVSTSMPGVVLELGNANNEVDLINLTDQPFRNRLVDAVLDAIEAYAGANDSGTGR